MTANSGRPLGEATRLHSFHEICSLHGQGPILVPPRQVWAALKGQAGGQVFSKLPVTTPRSAHAAPALLGGAPRPLEA